MFLKFKTDINKHTIQKYFRLIKRYKEITVSKVFSNETDGELSLIYEVHHHNKKECEKLFSKFKKSAIIEYIEYAEMRRKYDKNKEKYN